MDTRIRVAVVGVGALGKEHARIYAALQPSAQVTLAGVFDTQTAAATRIAAQQQCRAFASLEELADAADAVSVVTPTAAHYPVALELLQRGCHVLLEKPMTDNAAHAADLVARARELGLVLQVGHVERFNPVFHYLRSAATRPRFIEAHRLSPHPGRNADIGVVLDLMIHDLDVVLAFVDSPVVSVDAVGIPVLSVCEDIANVRLRFRNGCLANLTASRISPERLRKIRVFSAEPTRSYISLDYRAQEGFLYRLARAEEAESPLWKKLFAAKDTRIVTEFGGHKIVREPVPIRKEEPLVLELRSFIESVRLRHAPEVTGEAGKRALDLALEITEQIQRNAAMEDGRP
jgi:predicted dehydrogenase